MTRNSKIRRAQHRDAKWSLLCVATAAVISFPADARELIDGARSSSTSAALTTCEFRRRRNFELAVTWEARARTSAADARAALEELELCEQRTAPVIVEAPSGLELDTDWMLGLSVGLSVVAFAFGVVVGGMAL